MSTNYIFNILQNMHWLFPIAPKNWLFPIVTTNWLFPIEPKKLFDAIIKNTVTDARQNIKLQSK